MAKYQVRNAINKYINENNLRSNNGLIKPDSKLSTLLFKKKGHFEFNDYKLIMYLKHHEDRRATPHWHTQNYSVSGTPMPKLVSNEMAEFFNKSSGWRVELTELNKLITDYIHKNNLQDSQNPRNIIPDTNFKRLLRLNDGEHLTFFNLHMFVNKHVANSKLYGKGLHQLKSFDI